MVPTLKCARFQIGISDPQLVQFGKIQFCFQDRKFEQNGMRMGTVVEISGLKSAAGQKLNGKSGVIESFDHAKGRWRVLVNGKLSSFKPENVQKRVEHEVQDLLDDVDVEEVKINHMTYSINLGEST